LGKIPTLGYYRDEIIKMTDGNFIATEKYYRGSQVIKTNIYQVNGNLSVAQIDPLDNWYCYDQEHDFFSVDDSNGWPAGVDLNLPDDVYYRYNAFINKSCVFLYDTNEYTCKKKNGKQIYNLKSDSYIKTHDYQQFTGDYYYNNTITWIPGIYLSQPGYVSLDKKVEDIVIEITNKKFILTMYMESDYKRVTEITLGNSTIQQPDWFVPCEWDDLVITVYDENGNSTVVHL
jgi:hypothetical protein